MPSLSDATRTKAANRENRETYWDNEVQDYIVIDPMPFYRQDNRGMPYFGVGDKLGLSDDNCTFEVGDAMVRCLFAVVPAVAVAFIQFRSGIGAAERG